MDPALKRLGRVLLGILTVLLGIAAIAGIVVVVLTSTDWGHERVRRFALAQLQSRLHGRVSIGRLSGNLLSGLTVHDLAISDSSGEPFLAAQEVSARYALDALVGKKVWLEDVRLVRPLIVLDRQPGAKWNYQRIFATDTTQRPSTGPGFGSWIRLENVTVVDGDLIVRTPWSPGTRLSAVARDSAIRDALAGKGRTMVVQSAHAYGGEPPYQKVVELRSLNASLPILRLADPNQKYRYAEVASLQMTALPFRPPAAVVTEMRGNFQFDNLIINSTASANGFGTTISSFLSSNAIACDVRARRVRPPSITLTGAVFPFANLANIAIRGLATQLGTRICCRVGS